MSFDARSLLVFSGILAWILAATIEFQAVRPDRERMMPDPWTIALLAKGLGLNLISQRGLISDFWSISLANTLLLVGPLFCYAALQRMRGVSTNYLLIAAVPVSVGILLPVIGFAPAQFPARTMLFTCAGLFGFALNCWSAFQLGRAGFRAGAALLLGTSVVLAAVLVAHAVAVVGGGLTGLLGGAGIQLALYGVNAACIALSTFGYMDVLRTVRERQTRIDPDLLPDPLTGLYSRQAFLRSGQSELVRARLRGNPVSVLMVQIDGFEPLGAAQGRAFADQQLRRVAAEIQKSIRNFDFAGRLAANTIGILMPELPLAEGEAAAERIRAAIEAEPAEHHGNPLRVTISIGLCGADPEHEDLESAMALASACLYRAHLAGGNQVATPASPPLKGFVEGTV